MIIPKDAYVLFCLDENGNSTILYPQRHKKTAVICDKTYNSSTIVISTGNDYGFLQTGQIEYITDFAEIEQHLRKNYPGEYKKVLICKVVDILTIKIESDYKEKN